MLISIFDEQIRGSYNQGVDQFFKLTNFFENSQEFYNEFSKRDNDGKNKKSTFCSLPYFKNHSQKQDYVAGCCVITSQGVDKVIYLSSNDVGTAVANKTTEEEVIDLDLLEVKKEEYNVPVFLETGKKSYITYPTYYFRNSEYDENKAELQSIFIDDDKKQVIRNSETEIYKLRKLLKKSNITVLETHKDFIKNSHPLFLKYYHLLIYTYSGCNFFFYGYKPEELDIEEDVNSNTDVKSEWQIIKIQYDGAKIQQIIELHGYIFIFLKDKTVVYSLSYGDSASDSKSQIDISESSGQNLPIGTDNTFSALKYMNKIITIFNNGVYTIAQFQPSKISLPAVDEWISENKKLGQKISLLIVKEQSYEFLYVICNKSNEAWVLNFHNNKWSFTDYSTPVKNAYKKIDYSEHTNTSIDAKYLTSDGDACSYESKLPEEQCCIIETGVISLSNNCNLLSISEIILSFNSLPNNGCKLKIEYKSNKSDEWVNLGGMMEINPEYFKGGEVLHKRIKLRASQFLLKITFTPDKKDLKPIIINDIVFRATS